MGIGYFDREKFLRAYLDAICKGVDCKECSLHRKVDGRVLHCSLKEFFTNVPIISENRRIEDEFRNGYRAGIRFCRNLIDMELTTEDDEERK